MSNSIKIFILSLGLIFAINAVAFAQETILDEVTEAIELDENIQAADLDVEEPGILPDHPFYFLKNWGREIRSFFTFNSIAKAELREGFANEKLMELKKMVEAKKNTKAIEKAANNYQKEVEAVKRVSENIRERAEENVRVEGFLDKFVKYQILHQRLLQKLEDQVPSEAFEKIKEAREKHLEKFGEVMTKLEDREDKITETLENGLEEIKGSEYKNFKNLEVLLALGEKVPEEAKAAIIKAQENSLNRLHGDLENMSPEDQEKFEEYLAGISGMKERQIEILDNIRARAEQGSSLKENMLKARERVLEEVQEKVQERTQERVMQIDCLEINKPALDFCQEGRITIKKDENGCIVSFGCVIPAEVEISQASEEVSCYTLWDPVCGKDGKTYSNDCFAGLANIDIDYEGKCREIGCQSDADCPQPRCAPMGSTRARCIERNRCIDGICQIISE